MRFFRLFVVAWRGWGPPFVSMRGHTYLGKWTLRHGHVVVGPLWVVW